MYNNAINFHQFLAPLIGAVLSLQIDVCAPTVILQIFVVVALSGHCLKFHLQQTCKLV